MINTNFHSPVACSKTRLEITKEGRKTENGTSQILITQSDVDLYHFTIHSPISYENHHETCLSTYVNLLLMTGALVE